MVNTEIVRRRLDQLSDYLQILDHYQSYSLEEFLADPERYGSAERFLQLAVEAILDVGNHIVADEQLGRVEKSRDVAALFLSKGFIDDRLAQKWLRMIGFRNILVHEYAELDRRIVYKVLCEQLHDFSALSKVFTRFL